TLVMCDYFKEAQKIAKELKSSFVNDPEMMAELRRIELVAERNNIALTVISRLGTPDPSVKISFTLSHHPFFATAIVKRS
ncbi:N-alpha-acetyltransferase 35 NatC auxiliary subunit-like, partial [Trifolium medium]|nr:N-alpha-acetyltransferase 35 NatC auxiliary subunit-like [Trifolium medium]